MMLIDRIWRCLPVEWPTAIAPTIGRMGKPYQRSHIASVTYLDQWAVDGRLRVVRPGRHVGSAPARPEAVAYRKRFWSDDPEIQRLAEEACARLESQFPEAAAKIATDWPLTGAAREVLAEFISLHVIRTPAWMEFHDETRSRLITDLEHNWEHSIPFEEAERQLSSDEQRVKTFQRHLLMTTALVANMHWTLLSWEHPVLATSDHPVSLFPMAQPGVLTPYEAFPRKGLGGVLELRFPLSPSQLLIGSWIDQLDQKLDPVGDQSWVINSNESITGNAEHEWFFRPGSFPRLTPVIERRRRPSTPISLDLGVDALEVVGSERRRHAMSELDRIAEAGDESTFIRVAEAKAPRRSLAA